MFNSTLIKNISQRCPEFNKIHIEYAGTPLSSYIYDLINYQLISYNTVNSCKDNLIIIHPHKDTFGILFLAFSALSNYKKAERDEIKPEEIEPNSLVFIKENPNKQPQLIRFIGVVLKNSSFGLNCKYFHLQYLQKSGHLDRFLPVEGNFKFYKYHGTGIEPQQFGSKSSKRQNDRVEVIREIYGQSEDDISLFENYEILVVADYNDFNEEITNITINNIEFVNLFPTAYYPSVDSPRRLGRDNNKRSPIIHFASDMSVAYEILLKNKEIKQVIINGAKKLKNNFSILSSMIESNEAEDVCVLLDISEIDEASKLEKSSYSFVTWCWFKEDLVELSSIKANVQNAFNGNKNINSLSSDLREKSKRIYCQESNLIQNNPRVKIHNNLVKLCNDSSHEVRAIPFPKQLDIEKVRNTKQILRKLLRTESRMGLEKLYLLIVNAYKLLNQLLTMPISPSDFDAYVTLFERNCSTTSDLFVLLEELASEILKVSLPFELRSDIEKLSICLGEIKDKFMCDSNKLEGILTTVSEHWDKNIILVVRDSERDFDFREMVRHYLVERLPEFNIDAIKIINIRELASSYEQRNDELIIFTGFTSIHKSGVVLENILCPKISLLYPSEQEDFEFYNTRAVARLSMLRDSGLRAYLLGVEPESKSCKFSDISDKRSLDEEILELCSNITQSKILESSSCNDPVEARILMFNDGYYYAYIPESGKAKVLNRETKSIEDVDIDDLEINDELVFLADSRKSIFESYIELIDDRDLKRVAASWQVALNTYIQDKGMEVSILKEKFRMLGIKRTKQTIRGWIKDRSIIGPYHNNYEAIRAIAKLTNNEYLNSNLEEVISSCQKLRGIHVQIGRYLASKIINAFLDISEDDKVINRETKNRVDDLAKHVRVVTLANILPDIQLISYAKTGRLFEFKG